MVIVINHANALKKPQLLLSCDTLNSRDIRQDAARRVMRPSQPPDTQKPQTAKQQANERLARALRDNLHRRKAQARARKSPSVTDAGGMLPLDEKSSTE